MLFSTHPKELKPPDDLQTICDDLKLCGRREFAVLIRLRHKYLMIQQRAKKAVEDEEAAKAKLDEVPEDEEAKIDRELEETMLRIAKEKKRVAKKEKIAKDKTELRKKMSVIATTTLDNDEDLHLSNRLWDEIRRKGFEKVGDNSDDEDSDDGDDDGKGSDDSMDDDLETTGMGKTLEGSDADGDSSSDESIDEKQARINQMAEDMED